MKAILPKNNHQQKGEGSSRTLKLEHVNHSRAIKCEYLNRLELPPTIDTGNLDRVTGFSTDTGSGLDVDSLGRDKETKVQTQEKPRSIKRSAASLQKRKKIRKGLIRERHIIQHNYHDHAFEPVDFDDYVLDHDTSCAVKKKGGVSTPFPLKLHELLEKADEEGLNHIVSWQPHGRAFIVNDPNKFVSQLIHRFFRQTKLTSFQRQLNLYGFCRLTKGPDGGGYYHELFLRGRPYLTKRMVRTKIKGTGCKAASNPECEPDFYGMAPVGNPCSNAFPISKIEIGKYNDPFVTSEPRRYSSQESGDKMGEAFLQELPCSSKSASSRYEHQPILRPSVALVRDQSFQCMQPLKPVAESFVGDTKLKCSLSIERSGSVSINEDPSSSLIDSKEGSEKSNDPFSVFLSEVGTDFEDDINIGHICNDLLDKKNLTEI